MTTSSICANSGAAPGVGDPGSTPSSTLRPRGDAKGDCLDGEWDGLSCRGATDSVRGRFTRDTFGELLNALLKAVNFGWGMTTGSGGGGMARPDDQRDAHKRAANIPFPFAAVRSKKDSSIALPRGETNLLGLPGGLWLEASDLLLIAELKTAWF